MDKNNIYYKMLIEVLRLVSMDSETQINLFPEDVSVTDEIALLFSDTFLLIKQNKDKISVDNSQYKLIEKIDNLFNEMSNSNKDFWLIDALKKNPQWQSLRELGNTALKHFGEKKESPNLFWINYY
jgi:DNA mismatch repair ATPase MutL